MVSCAHFASCGSETWIEFRLAKSANQTCVGGAAPCWSKNLTLNCHGAWASRGCEQYRCPRCLGGAAQEDYVAYAARVAAMRQITTMRQTASRRPQRLSRHLPPLLDQQGGQLLARVFADLSNPTVIAARPSRARRFRVHWALSAQD